MKVTGHMAKSTQVMAHMNKLVKISDISATMMDMQREMMKVRCVRSALLSTALSLYCHPALHCTGTVLYCTGTVLLMMQARCVLSALLSTLLSAVLSLSCHRVLMTKVRISPLPSLCTVTMNCGAVGGVGTAARFLT